MHHFVSTAHSDLLSIFFTKMNNDDSKPQDIAVKESAITIVRANPALVNEHWEPLANLDLFIPDEYVDIILCYQKPNVAYHSMVASLKKSLADTLVEYYVFGGELVCNDSSGELEIFCNNRGVDFTEVCVDMELSELDIHKPDELIRGGKLSPPRKKGGNLAVQVTKFMRCGSLVIVCKFDHRVADAYSTNMFLVSWSENTLSKPLSYSPSRIICHPRYPPRHGLKIECFYSPMSSLPPPFTRDTSSVSRVYYVTADQTVALQAAASTETSRRSKLESFSAFLWQVLAKSSYQDNNKKEELITKMSIVIDARTRLSSTYDSESFISYFGNAISAPYVSETVEAVSYKPLTWIGARVADVIKAAANKDHFLDLIDLVETTRPDTIFPNIFWPRSTDGPKVVVSSGLRFPIAKIDFGWGSPLLGFYCLPWAVDSGYVMPVQIPAGNGDWLVYMHLPACQVEYIEKEASHVFRPFNMDFISR